MYLVFQVYKKLCRQNLAASYGQESMMGVNGLPFDEGLMLYVGSLNYNITKDMLRGFFEQKISLESILSSATTKTTSTSLN